MGHPWPRTANPASCRVTHEFKPAFGQRGLTGRLRSRSKADQDQERLASHRSYRWLRRTAQLCRSLCCDSGKPTHDVPTVRPPSQASQLPHLDCGASVRSASAVSPSREQAPSPQVQHWPKLCRSLCCDSGKPTHDVLTVRLLSQASQLPQGFVAAVRRRTWPPSHSNQPPTSTAHGWPRWSGWRPPPTGWPGRGC